MVLGIGDDAAVLRQLGPLAVVSADMLIAGVDFERAWATPKDIGHKAAAVNLSDLAAMGARPRALVASIACHPEDNVDDVVNLLLSLHRTGAALGAPLVGGDISKTAGPWVVAVTVLGEVAPRHVLQRYRGRPGDYLCVSGRLGAAAAGLLQLQGQGKRSPALVQRQLRPTPRVALGRALAGAGCVRSAADISDGLAKDAAHVVRPGAGVEIDVRRLPLAYGVAAVARGAQQMPWQMALCGGEDFELVLAVAPAAWPQAEACAKRCGLPLTVVGRVTAAPGIVLLHAPEGAVLRGFDHFAPHADSD